MLEKLLNLDAPTLMAFESPTREDFENNKVNTVLSADADGFCELLNNVGAGGQNSILEKLLLYKNIPSIEEINFILARFGFPGLYLSTFNKAICKRNAVITAALEVFALHPEKDGITKIKMLNKALSEFSLEKFSSKPDYAYDDDDFDNDNIYEAFFKACYSRINYVNTVVGYNSRNDYLERYAKANNSTVSNTVAMIKKNLSTIFSDVAINNLFVNDPTVANRDIIIRFGILLDCNINEISKLLIEANRPMLSSVRDSAIFDTLK